MKASARGFTLLEVLVAVAVLAMALGAIISGMARYADNAGYLRQKTIAIWVAHNRLTEVELEDQWPEVGKSDGEAEMAGIKWKWRMVVQETQDDNLRRVDIEVLAPQSGTGSSQRRDDAVLAQLSSFIMQ